MKDNDGDETMAHEQRVTHLQCQIRGRVKFDLGEFEQSWNRRRNLQQTVLLGERRPPVKKIVKQLAQAWLLPK